MFLLTQGTTQSFCSQKKPVTLRGLTTSVSHLTTTHTGGATSLGLTLKYNKCLTGYQPRSHTWIQCIREAIPGCLTLEYGVYQRWYQPRSHLSTVYTRVDTSLGLTFEYIVHIVEKLSVWVSQVNKEYIRGITSLFLTLHYSVCRRGYQARTTPKYSSKWRGYQPRSHT